MKELQSAIVEAVRKAFAEVRQKHPGEHFYSFVLFTEPELGYLIPSSNSEEGLRRVGGNELRWNPPDWPYHGEGKSHFRKVQRCLDRIQPAITPARLHSSIWKAFIGALRNLDSARVFGAGVPREEILINIMWGDQDLPLHLKSARALNPKNAFLRYAKDELPSLRSMAREMARYPAARTKLAKLRRLITELTKASR